MWLCRDYIPLFGLSSLDWLTQRVLEVTPRERPESSAGRSAHVVKLAGSNWIAVKKQLKLEYHEREAAICVTNTDKVPKSENLDSKYMGMVQKPMS